jgi:hypothetical protein
MDIESSTKDELQNQKKVKTQPASTFSDESEYGMLFSLDY